jgi:hypothetical protein
MLGRIVREPLVHFGLLGAALFIVYGLLAPASSQTSSIAISSDQIVSLAEQFRSSWQRAPTRDELERLIDARVRDEVLYREGLALGLDRDDPVVRTRIRQKMEVLAEDALTAEPTTADLQTFLDAHPEQFALPATLSFEQIYFDPSRRGASLDADVRRARGVLRAGGQVRSDPTMLPAQRDRADAADITSVFGTAFEASLHTLPIGIWSEPVQSSFGYHLVRISARTPATVPALADVRDVVAREWSRTRTAEAKERLYRSYLDRYAVKIAPIPDSAVSGTRAGVR